MYREKKFVVIFHFLDQNRAEIYDFLISILREKKSYGSLNTTMRSSVFIDIVRSTPLLAAENVGEKIFFSIKESGGGISQN